MSEGQEERKGLEPLLRDQRRASDPSATVWVRANAGSGKTFVLALRVLRLLLDGTAPGAILCLTFTRAAAAEMQTRVFKRLADWAVCPDEALERDLGNLLGHPPSAGDVINARRLFARAIETPGGLKIQTIHAFAERLLHQFPLEAGVPPGFSLLDDRQQKALLAEARTSVLSAAMAGDEGQADLATIAAYASEEGFGAALGEFISRREDMRAALDREGREGALLRLARQLGVNPEEGMDAFEAQILDQSIVPPASWRDLAAVLMEGTGKEQEKAAELLSALESGGSGQIAFWKGFCLTAKETPRKSLLTKPLATRFPQWLDRLEREAERLCALAAARKTREQYEITAVLLRMGERVLDLYEQEKRARALLDYDDLIAKTAAMLGRMNMAWVLFKLDRGIDHVLVDEAQDTSEEQWAIIAQLVSEFFAGEGVRPGIGRTLFVVGDEKQSIYSFQGANPDLFDLQRRLYARRAAHADKPWQDVPLNMSFRTVPEILEVVDAIFEGAARKGLVSGQEKVSHSARRADESGFVELWPMIAPDEKAEVKPWDAPLDAVTAADPQIRLAERIAGTIRGWLDGKKALPSSDAPVSPKDILILVRSRSLFFEVMLKALKDHGIPVAGADRLKLSEHIAIEDLVAAGQAVLLPEDDLNLAALLKSPLFGLDDDDLLALAPGRKGTLLEALQASPEARHVAAAERIARWRERADFVSPYVFYATIMSGEGGWEAFLSRLGKDAEDPIAAFLDQALDYSLREAATLQGFIAWFGSAEQEIKRDMEQEADAVRIMTVHGAKGLEAPIVFLADTVRVPDKTRKPCLLDLPGESEALPSLPLWRTSGNATPMTEAMDETWLEENFAEYHRLLYVALTRARDGLIVCGARGQREAADNCWYNLVRGAFTPLAQPTEREGETVLTYGSPLRTVQTPMAETPRSAADIPAFVATSYAPAAPQVRVLSPSSAWMEEAGEAAEGAEGLPAAGAARPDSDALVRGRLVHALFQYLPSLAPEERQGRAAAYLGVKAPEMAKEGRAGIAAEVMAVLEDPAYAHLFAPDALAEVPLTGEITWWRNGKEERVGVSGVIDRLTRLKDRWIILDYKTDQRVPGNPWEVGDAYVSQLALYARLIRSLPGPDKVEAALLYTRGPQLIVFDEALLAARLAKRGITL